MQKDLNTIFDQIKLKSPRAFGESTVILDNIQKPTSCYQKPTSGARVITPLINFRSERDKRIKRIIKDKTRQQKK